MKTSKKPRAVMYAILISLMSYQANSQPWYGQLRYPHDSTTLCSAKRTFNDTGFIMAGFRPVRQNGGASPDFVIDKVSPNGLFSTANDFSKRYQILADPANCTSPVAVNNCVGVTIIETKNQGSGEAYAIVGAYNKGVFFATLKINGTVINRRFWAFPSNSGIANKKPSLRESKTNPGKYYICGSSNATTYVMKVAANGAQIWGNIYTAFTTEARDLIESPYNANELIVVGRTDVTFPTSAADAFFMSINANTGAVNSFKNYNFLSWDSDDWFASIDLANSQTGGQGYVLGGRAFGPTSMPPGPNNIRYTQWMCKLGANGNVIWSTLIKPKAFIYGNLEGNEVDRVYERLDPNTGKYEYYGVAASYYTKIANGTVQPLNNLVVYKLNDLGGLNATVNEFHYTGGSFAPAGVTCAYADLTGIQANQPGDGFQAFGTDQPTKNHYFIRSYFNGAAGCRDTSLNIDSIFVGPHLVGNNSIAVTTFTQCGTAGGTLSVTAQSPIVNQVCYANSLPSGSNARYMTGIEALSEEGSQIKMYPNPVKDRVTLAVPAYIKDRISVTIFNNLGQKVEEYEYANTDNGEFVIDFNALNVKSGFYFVQVMAGSLKNNYKIVYDGK